MAPPLRILHVSDLHFGEHNENLLTSLETRLKDLQADVVLATGDLADAPKVRLLTDARRCLERLAGLCNSAQPIRLIVVPGNHDVGYWGNISALDSYRKYARVFAGLPNQNFFKPESVWIYGFNSTRERGFGANGFVTQKDLNSFDAAYQEAKQYGKEFENSYKIVALHHHPLPIRYDPEYARWVTLLNAGEFLEQMLNHGIDLVVHGHEHVHAKATFSKRIRPEDKGELIVVSVGSVFHKSPGPDHNRFNLIKVDSDKEVTIESYEAKGGTFDMNPVDKIEIRSPLEAEENNFNQIVAQKGYKYARVVANTVINQDGDVHRVIDFLGLSLFNDDSERARQHELVLPATSGYIDDVLVARELKDQVPTAELPFRPKQPIDRGKRVEAVIEYGKKLHAGANFNLRAEWWAVNAMAMSKNQYQFKYDDGSFLEFTHFPVLDPIDELWCLLTFPEKFRLTSWPMPYVAVVTSDETGGKNRRVTTLEDQLGNSIYYESSVKAILRVPRPQIGNTFGFIWSVPPDAVAGARDGTTDALVDKLLKFRSNKDRAKLDGIRALLVSLDDLVRGQLLPEFTAELGFSIMVFDRQRLAMVFVAAMAKKAPDVPEWPDHDALSLEYGEGIAGKAFKTGEPRLYVRAGAGQRRSPDYYRELPGLPPRAVILAVPLHHPGSKADIYAVLNCSSPESYCPLRDLGASGTAVSAEKFGNFQAAVNRHCYDELKAIFLQAS